MEATIAPANVASLEMEEVVQVAMCYTPTEIRHSTFSKNPAL